VKKILSLSVLGFFAVTLAVHPGLGQTAQDILKKMVEAQGGKKVFESIQDMTFSGTLEMIQQGMTGALAVYKKEPDKRRVDIDFQGFVVTQAFDGEAAWGTNLQTFATEVFSGEEAASLKRDSMPLVASLDPEKYGISYLYKGREKIDNKDYFVLEASYADGFKATFFIDPETYLPHKTKTKAGLPMSGEAEIEQIDSDYKKVGEMTIAHSTITYANGQEYMKIVISNVSFNTGLSESLFKMK